MRHLDLFSGIGGFALAASWVWGENYEIISFVEIDEFCQNILKKHWPDVPVHDDIRTLNSEKIMACAARFQQGRHKQRPQRQRAGQGGESINLLTGGFPCQPYSVAGKRRGAADDRALWPQMHRVIRECRPRWVIGENVAGIVNMELDTVFIDLENAGYTVESFIIPACAVDAPHRRDRVWIVAHRNGTGLQNRQLDGQEICESDEIWKDATDHKPEIEGESDVCKPKRSGQTGNNGGRSGQESENRCRDVADAEKRTIGTGLRPKEPREIGRGRFGDRGCNVPKPDAERCNGRQNDEGQASPERNGNKKASWWLAEPYVGRVANGVPDRVDRLKALGNAIVPQVVVPIMECIKEIEESKNHVLQKI